ncbi:MAG: hypothetical protein Q4D04_16035 [Clostridia bacterium]|nr:hypothetical protein [Clostridia bacterium]
METEKMNEIIEGFAKEAASQEITTEVATNGSALKTMGIIGGIAGLGIVAWEFAIKPVARKAKSAYQKAVDKRKINKAKQNGDILEIDGDIDEKYPIK